MNELNGMVNLLLDILALQSEPMKYQDFFWANPSFQVQVDACPLQLALPVYPNHTHCLYISQT